MPLAPHKKIIAFDTHFTIDNLRMSTRALFASVINRYPGLAGDVPVLGSLLPPASSEPCCRRAPARCTPACMAGPRRSAGHRSHDVQTTPTAKMFAGHSRYLAIDEWRARNIGERDRKCQRRTRAAMCPRGALLVGSRPDSGAMRRVNGCRRRRSTGGGRYRCVPVGGLMGSLRVAPGGLPRPIPLDPLAEPSTPGTQTIEIQIHHRRRIEGEELTEDQATDDGDA